jgi:hypothetical protein
MGRRFLCTFANVLVAAYAADAAISLLHLLTEAEALASIRNALALFVFLQSLFAIPLLGITRRLPLSVFLPIMISAFCFNIGLIPVMYYVDWPVLETLVVVAQCLIAWAVFLRVRSLRGGERWLFDLDWFSGRLFSLPYFVGYEIGAFSLLLASIVGLGVAGLAIGADFVTKGFVRFDSEGISLADRLYENQGRRIRLVGMMHIGEDEGYRKLFHDLGTGSSSMLVLTEGVSDSDGLLRGQLSYGSLAEILGVGEQQSIEDYVDWQGREGEGKGDGDPVRPVFMNADLDLNEFDPRTIELLEELGELYRGDDFLGGFLQLSERMREDPEASAGFTEDLIGRRNRTVIAHIIDFKEDYREIVVPWGAMHLPGIATAIEEMGFVRRSTRYIQFISWRRVVGALLRASEEKASLKWIEGVRMQAFAVGSE